MYYYDVCQRQRQQQQHPKELIAMKKDTRVLIPSEYPREEEAKKKYDELTQSQSQS